MAKIAKAYNSIFEDPNVITASDTRRAFSDAFDLFNGNLSSENFNAAISINQDNVSFSTSDWTSTALIGVLGEIKNQNYHNFHFMGVQTHVVSAFKGRGFINGSLNKINTRIDLTASDSNYTGGSITTGSWMVLMGEGVSGIITASDIALTLTSNVSQSLAWDNDKQGYYPSIASGNRRAFFTLRNVWSASNRMVDEMWLDPPWDNQIYRLTNQEASSIGFTGIAVTTSTNGQTLDSVTRYYDSQDRRYGYWLRGNWATNSALANTTLNGNISIAPIGPADGWRLNNVSIISDTRSQTIGADSNIRYNSSVVGQISMTFQNIITLEMANTSILGSFYQFKMERVFGLINYRVRGDRG